MAFDWERFIPLSKDLTKSGDEAADRSAVSRAYYAAHHLSKDFAESYLGMPRATGGEAHGITISALKKASDQTIAKAGLNLQRLSSNRGKADYDADYPIKSSFAAFSVGLAESVINALKSWRP